MNTHTLGPWELDIDTHNGEHSIVAYDGTVICYPSGVGPSADADISLIEAAPDLLAALVPLLDCYICTANSENNHYDPETNVAVIRARAAIAKATK